MNNSAFIQVDLLRHGETEGGARYRGVTDDPLTVAGREQMWAAVGDDTHWECIVTSPLIRCVEFAHALSQRRSIPLRVDERLREMDFGAWEGRSSAELMDTAPDALTRFWSDPQNNTPPAAEPLLHMQTRVLAAWRDIVAHGKSVLLVTHGGPIRVILCHLFGHPLQKLLEIDVPHAALRQLRVDLNGSRALETQTR